MVSVYCLGVLSPVNGFGLLRNLFKGSRRDSPKSPFFVYRDLFGILFFNAFSVTTFYGFGLQKASQNGPQIHPKSITKRCR